MLLHRTSYIKCQKKTTNCIQLKNPNSLIHIQRDIYNIYRYICANIYFLCSCCLKKAFLPMHFLLHSHPFFPICTKTRAQMQLQLYFITTCILSSFPICLYRCLCICLLNSKHKTYHSNKTGHKITKKFPTVLGSGRHATIHSCIKCMQCSFYIRQPVWKVHKKKNNNKKKNNKTIMIMI